MSASSYELNIGTIQGNVRLVRDQRIIHLLVDEARVLSLDLLNGKTVLHCGTRPGIAVKRAINRFFRLVQCGRYYLNTTYIRDSVAQNNIALVNGLVIGLPTKSVIRIIAKTRVSTYDIANYISSEERSVRPMPF